MILQGDALACLRELPAATIQTCITSPPYFGLRDYGTGEWTGGDPECDHAERELRRGVNLAQSAASTRGGAIKAAEVGWLSYRDVCGKCGAQRVGTWTGGDSDCDHSHARTRTVGNAPSTKSTLTTNNGQGPKPGDKYHADQQQEVATVCDCGAILTDGQLGLEATPDEYIARLVEVFREVRRVLRDDGTLWLNIGDSYAGPKGWRPEHQATSTLGPKRDGLAPDNAAFIDKPRGAAIPAGVKQKDLLGIPWMLAFALRTDGWYLRSDVIWAKPNPMPESVTDRPTSAHEHVFLLAKQPRYYYDAEAIREQSSPDMVRRATLGHTRGPNATRDPSRSDADALVGGIAVEAAGRNKRNVWTIATQPYAEAHFATFPTKLVEPCVLAGSSPKACGVCGAPWQRVVDAETVREHGGTREMDKTPLPVVRAGWRDSGPQRETTGWQPTCDHDDDTGRCVVLDPFAGSGTVGVVCGWHNREFVGIELNADYCRMAGQRIEVEGRGGRLKAPPEQIDGQLSLDMG